MEIFFCDVNGSMQGLANRFSWEGNKVYYYTEAYTQKCGGMYGLEIVEELDGIEKCDFYLSDVELNLPDMRGYNASSIVRELGVPENFKRTMELCGLEVNDKKIEREDCVCTISGFISKEGITPLGILSIQDNWQLNDNLGPYIPAQGTVSKGLRIDSKLWKETFEKFSKFLLKAGIEGMVNLVCVVEEESVRMCGVTCYPDINVLSAFSEVVLESLAEWMKGAISGEGTRQSEDFGLAVRCSISPWPFGTSSLSSRNVSPQVDGIEEEALKHIIFCDMKENLEGFLLVDTASNALYSCGRGDSIPRARSRAYRTLKNLKHPLKQYRTDVGVLASKSMTNLKNWGWI